MTLAGHSPGTGSGRNTLSRRALGELQMQPVVPGRPRETEVKGTGRGSRKGVAGSWPLRALARVRRGHTGSTSYSRRGRKRLRVNGCHPHKLPSSCVSTPPLHVYLFHEKVHLYWWTCGVQHTIRIPAITVRATGFIQATAENGARLKTNRTLSERMPAGLTQHSHSGWVECNSDHQVSAHVLLARGGVRGAQVRHVHLVQQGESRGHQTGPHLHSAHIATQTRARAAVQEECV